MMRYVLEVLSNSKLELYRLEMISIDVDGIYSQKDIVYKVTEMIKYET